MADTVKSARRSVSPSDSEAASNNSSHFACAVKRPPAPALNLKSSMNSKDPETQRGPHADPEKYPDP